MHPKRRPFRPPILVIVAVAFLAAIFLYSAYHTSSPPIFSSAFSSTVNPNRDNFKLLIKVLAYKRLAPLKRCLNSLSASDYGSDRVNLDVYLDHFKIPESKNQTLIRELNDLDNEILHFLDGFKWRHGDKQIHYSSSNLGIQGQWIRAWKPQSVDEFAFIVEDDLELSPLYYRFLKAAIFKYYYDKSNYNPSIFGVTLQRPRFVAGKHGNKIHLNNDENILLYQMVGTWGQLLFPKPWKEFLNWYYDHKSKQIKPILLGMVTTGWYNKMGERIWTPWFIKFIHNKSYFNIYTNFGKERALSVSHRDVGVNYGKTAGPDSTLITKMPSDINLFKMKGLNEIKWYDFCFKQVFVGRFVKRLDELDNFIKTLGNEKNIVLVSLFGIEEKVVRNLICHFERVGLRNYIFLGSDLQILSDLARRGHPVIDSSQLFNGDMIFIKGILVKKILGLGYNIWLMDGNMVPLNGIFANPPDNSLEILAKKNLELMFIKNSLIIKKFWTEKFISKIQEISKSFINKNFVSLVLKSLEKKGDVRIGDLNESIFPIDLDNYKMNNDNVKNRESIVYWTSPVKRELERVGLWLLDEDFSCKAVICQPQLKPN